MYIIEKEVDDTKIYLTPSNEWDIDINRALKVPRGVAMFRIKILKLSDTEVSIVKIN
jgi:hypothetical protein